MNRFLLVVVFISSMLLAGCSDSKPSAAPKAEPKVDAPQKGSKPSME